MTRMTRTTKDGRSAGDAAAGAADADPNLSLAAAAHEIKNALGPLGMTLQLAERQLLAGQPIAPADLAFARAQVRRLGSLVNDLLDLTCADLGEIPFRPCPADLRGVLTEAVEVFRRGGAAAAVALELPDAPLVAAVDAGRLLQVLINLLENAARYSPRGSPIVVGAARVGAAPAVIAPASAMPPPNSARRCNSPLPATSSSGARPLSRRFLIGSLRAWRHP